MSKRRSRGRSGTHSSRRAKGLSTPTLIAIGLLLAGGVMLFLLLASRSSETGAGSVPVEVSGAPRVSVVQNTIDLGTIHFNTTVESVFQVRNVGDQDLVIQGEPRVELVEGC